MSFNYDRVKEKQEGEGRQWASYSDLFMVLSIIFLLLYVFSSLRTGTYSLQKAIEFKQIVERNEELEEQIRVYNTLKNEHLAKSATERERETYTKLMGKLSLLQEEAKQEKEDLRKQAQENEEKEFALNQYQQIIRNIINTNMLAKTQIKRRDQIIETKDEILEQKEGQITELSEEIQEKKNTIAENKAEINRINKDLAKEIRKLKKTRKKAKMSKKKMRSEIKKLQKQSSAKIANLKKENKAVQADLSEVQSNLESKRAELAQVEQELQGKEEERKRLVASLETTKREYTDQIKGMREDFSAQMKSERDQLQEEIEKQKLNAREKAKRLAEFNKQAAAKERALKGKISELDSKVDETEQQLAGLSQKVNQAKSQLESERAKAEAERQQAQADKQKLSASIQGLKREKASIQGDLAKAKAKVNAKKNLAKRIADNFRRAGIKANVNGKTGDVTLSFGDEYFDTGSSKLKPKMKSILKEFVPNYAKSLLEDEKTAKKIENVEIIGYASSTYGGKYVNPKSLKPEDQKAINYNLNLSFDRANSIFSHIFDQKKLKYKYQKDLLPLVKVVGRGYLPEGTNAEDIPEGMSQREFCKRYDCKKAQKVILKFTLKD